MLLAVLVLNFLLGVVCLVVARGAGRSRALRLWGWGLLAYSAGIVITIAGFIPFDLRKVVGNALIAYAPILNIDGVLTHSRVRLKRSWTTAAWIVTVLPIVINHLSSHYEVLIDIFSPTPIAVVLFAAGAILLVRDAPRETRSAARFVAVSFVLAIIVWSVRLAAIWSSVGTTNDRERADLIVALFSIAQMVSAVASTLGLLWIEVRKGEAALRAAVEEAEAQRERAEDASRAKSIFLANMSHELRTPLNAVIGFSQLTTRSRTLTPGDRENLGIIRRGGEHLLALINDVLSLSKIEAGKLTLDLHPIDLRALIASVAELTRVRAEAAGLELIVGIDGSVPRTVVGDEGKLRQIVMNLLSNAVKFTKFGSVTLRARWSGDRAYFEVSDTGAGIDEEEMESLFKPFVQTASGRASKEGTGLGLAITRELVRMMGGEIRATSTRGDGTTFRFDVELPATAEAAERVERKRVTGIELGTMRPRIVVADDSRENRLLLVKLLQAVGLEAREATNGEEALALWRAWKPDVIFMDQRMPLMDGSAATRLIREAEARSPELRRTLIVAVTASVFEHERAGLIANGADAVIMKPYPEDAIFDVLAHHLPIRFLYEAPARGNHVLLVDDSSINRAVARDLLGRLGLDVTEAVNGVEALKMIDAQPFDAVLLDMEMPELDGRATLKEIRSRHGLHDLPVIAMTSHDRAEADAEGMTDYVAKPIEPDEVTAVLTRYVKIAPAPQA